MTPELAVVTHRSRVANGAGTILWLEASQRYRLRFQQGGVRREEYFSITHFGSRRGAKGEAERRRRVLAGQVASGRRVAVGRVTIGEQVERWLLRKRGIPAHGGYVDRAAHIYRHAIGSIPLDRLRGEDISGFYYDLEHLPQPSIKRGTLQPPEAWRPLGPKTIKHIAGVLNAALDLAVGQGLLPNGNPAKNERISPPRVRKRSYDLFEIDELDRMIDAAQGYLRPLLMLLARYALRPGEALALRWTDIGPSQLTIARSIRDLATTKTDAGFRTIPLSPGDAELLRAWRTRTGDSPWLFAGRDGSPLRPQTFGYAFTQLLRRTAIRHRRPYDCRHTAITMVIAYTRVTDGLSVADVARWAGHSQYSTTLNTYTHLLPSSRSLVESMARAFQVERLRVSDAEVHGDPNREPGDE